MNRLVAARMSPAVGLPAAGCCPKPHLKKAALHGSRPQSALALAFVVALMPLGCRQSGDGQSSRRLAATNTHLESAARELLGGDVQVIRLAEPGACPGHFDIRPSQMRELRSCRALLRFDFQQSLDAKLGLGDTNRFRVAEVTMRGGLCCPDNYLAACRQLAEVFVSLGWLSRAEADRRLEEVSARLVALAAALRRQIQLAGLASRPVIASDHQSDFCQWLGLKVVATFRAADTASVAEIGRAIDAGQLAAVKLVVANLPEGRRAADALAERLKARVVVFGNFPTLNGGRPFFDDLLLANVNALARAAGE